MDAFLNRHEKPVAAWYFAAFLTLAGCEDGGTELTPVAPRAERPKNHAEKPRGDAAATRCRLSDTTLVPCGELSGPQEKTWRVVSSQWDDKQAAPPFKWITFFNDGTWRDSSGLSGAWRFCARSRTLSFAIDSFDASLNAGVLQLSDNELVIEFANYQPGLVLVLAASCAG